MLTRERCSMVLSWLEENNMVLGCLESTWLSQLIGGIQVRFKLIWGVHMWFGRFRLIAGVCTWFEVRTRRIYNAQTHIHRMDTYTWRTRVACCIVLRCVAVCCSVLQCVAAKKNCVNVFQLKCTCFPKKFNWKPKKFNWKANLIGKHVHKDTSIPFPRKWDSKWLSKQKSKSPKNQFKNFCQMKRSEKTIPINPAHDFNSDYHFESRGRKTQLAPPKMRLKIVI